MKILVVEDEPLLRRSLSRVFESRGHKVICAENGRLGLQFWKSELPDVVLLDVLMPEMTGVQVLESMPDHKGAKVVLMTAYSGDSNQDLMRRFELDLFLPKPFENIFDLASQVEALFNEVKIP